MIVNFSIQNFGSIKDKQTLSFEADASEHLEDTYVVHTAGKRLLKLALIYGANASGKTTVLKALDFLRDLVVNPKEKKTDILNFSPYLFDTKTPQQPTELSIEFIHEEVCYQYEVAFTGQAVISEALYIDTFERVLVFSRTTDIEGQLTKISFGDKITLEKSALQVLELNTLWNNTVLGGFLKTNINLEEFRRVADWFNNYLKPLIAPQTQLDSYVTSKIDEKEIVKEEVLEILKKADFNISDIIIERRKDPRKGIDRINLFSEHMVNDISYKLPMEQESEGTKRFYGFAGLLALLIKTPTIFPIDELESSLHPDLYIHFLLSFLQNAQHSQLIATTHNRELLGDTDIFRNDVIWFTDKGEDFATQLYSLADFDTSTIKNILNAYKIGKFSAIPRLSDTFIDVTQ
ncbi:AAA family ATPase [Capnocytophaga ochracea]|jgi:putative ATP-binding protein|uniref:AAA family ATPase n=1 Tax=Capnocytophaga ochracea TaxID=1018 RepID=UPI00222E6058|nr:ATP-binding protein [Capnocytophaga ochracea]UZD36308.1 ATP-binding protein [Capnocytophaga ochracea]